jgi:hypothetical protein
VKGSLRLVSMARQDLHWSGGRLPVLPIPLPPSSLQINRYIRTHILYYELHQCALAVEEFSWAKYRTDTHLRPPLAGRSDKDMFHLLCGVDLPVLTYQLGTLCCWLWTVSSTYAPSAGGGRRFKVLATSFQKASKRSPADKRRKQTRLLTVSSPASDMRTLEI